MKTGATLAKVLDPARPEAVQLSSYENQDILFSIGMALVWCGSLVTKGLPTNATSRIINSKALHCRSTKRKSSWYP